MATFLKGKEGDFPIKMTWRLDSASTWTKSSSSGFLLSNEKKPKGWLGYKGDEILPSYIGIIS